jgi:hypothetical protein
VFSRNGLAADGHTCDDDGMIEEGTMDSERAGAGAEESGGDPAG